MYGGFALLDHSLLLYIMYDWITIMGYREHELILAQ